MNDFREFIPSGNNWFFEKAIPFYIIDDLVNKININGEKLVELENFEPECNMELAKIFINEKEKTIYLSWCMLDVDFGAEENEDWCLMIREELENAYPEYKIEWCIFAFCIFSREELTPEILEEFERASHKVYGIQEYYKFLGLEKNDFNREEYCEFFKHTVEMVDDI